MMKKKIFALLLALVMELGILKIFTSSSMITSIPL